MHPFAWRMALGSLVAGALIAGWGAADRVSVATAPELRCPTRVETRLADDAVLWVRGLQRTSLTRFEGRWDGEVLVFPSAPVSGLGELEVPGYVRADVRWAAHRCEPVTLLPAAPVVGTVHPDDGDIVVIGCGTQVEVGPGGSFYLEAPPVPCTLRALRSDGAFTASGPELEIRPTPGRDTVVDLSLPAPIGGVGIRFSIDDDGAVVDGVFPGTPADLAGLAEGDRIVAVDGDSTEGMDHVDFARAVIGPVGTAVTLGVETPDGPRVMELVRAAAD